MGAPTRVGALSQNQGELHSVPPIASFPGHVGRVNSWPGNEARLHPVYYTNPKYHNNPHSTMITVKKKMSNVLIFVNVVKMLGYVEN